MKFVRSSVSALVLLAGSTAAMGQNYLILAAESATNANAVQAALVAQGLTNVTVISATTLATPTLNELLAYDAVLTWTNNTYADGAAMGNVLADYVDAGGGVVCAVYCVSTTTLNRSLTGRWETGGYDIIPQRSGNLTTTAALGTVHLPSHALWNGITDFTGDTTPARSTTTAIASHGVRVADWDTGQVLAATSTTFPNRVDINIVPGDWETSAGGARLMANALLVADAGGNPQPGGCCLADGTCQFLVPSACATQGGVFHGAGTSCSNITCPQPAACCFASGTCQVMLATACTAQGGVFNPAAASCATANCPQPATGACCLLNNTCVTVWSGGCAQQGGIYRGDNTTCANSQCATLVVPNANTTVEGPGSNSFPFTSTGTYMRHQQVYAAGEFASLTEPTEITAIRFRGNESTTAPVWETTFDLVMTMSTTANGPDALSTTFASNVGADVVTVYNGSVTIGTVTPTPVPSGPANFEVVINLQTPFTYNPASGNLLVDVTRNGTTIGTSRFLDSVSATGDPTSRVSSSTVGATTGTLSSIGLVTLFELGGGDPGPACYANCDGSTTVPVLNVADFTCFLQSYAAGESYANCDGSTTVPVLNVADFTCFLQSYAAGCP